jgi:hypothetical protein
VCGLWHNRLETNEWNFMECIVPYNFQEDLKENVEQAVEIASGYENTFN